MEPLFVNHYVRDREMAKDLYGYIYFRRPMIIFFDLVFALCFFQAICKLVAEGYADLFNLCLPAYWVVIISLLYFKNVRNMLRRDLELHGKPVEVTVSVGEQGIFLENSNGSNLQLQYSVLKKVVQTKKFIYLRTKTNLFCPLKKGSFSVGSEEALLSFLKSKGIKAK